MILKFLVGNYGVLIKSGFNHYQALLFNLISASTCLIGFYIGVSVSNDFQVGEWILTITAGMFLYIGKTLKKINFVLLIKF